MSSRRWRTNDKEQINEELVPWLEKSKDPWLRHVNGILKEMNKNWEEMSERFSNKAVERVKPFQ